VTTLPATAALALIIAIVGGAAALALPAVQSRHPEHAAPTGHPLVVHGVGGHASVHSYRSVVSPRDASSGLASGKRTHKPIT
jgi:hypothetical protein